LGGSRTGGHRFLGEEPAAEGLPGGG
jgi:hypothetical protein